MPRPISSRTTLGTLRKRLEMTAEEFAKETGLSKSTVYAIECGARDMNSAIADRIAAVFMIDPTWLTDLDPEAPIRDMEGIKVSEETSLSIRDDYPSQLLISAERLVRRARREANQFHVFFDLHMALESIAKKYFTEEASEIVPRDTMTRPRLKLE